MDNEAQLYFSVPGEVLPLTATVLLENIPYAGATLARDRETPARGEAYILLRSIEIVLGRANARAPQIISRNRDRHGFWRINATDTNTAKGCRPAVL
jgi:hypothetical protein